MTYIPLNFKKGLRKGALVDCDAYDSTIVESELKKVKQQAPNSNFRIDNTRNFQKHVANDWLEKPIATAALNWMSEIILLQISLS